MKIFLAATLFVPFTDFAQSLRPEVSCKESKAPLFRSNDVLEISMKGKFPATTSSPAEIKYLDKGQNLEKSIPIIVAGRGKTRGTCQFRPIRISWDETKKGIKKDTIFSHTKGKDMKLTVHCRYIAGRIDQNLEANEVIVKEYMVYKILKAFGLPSFDVRLAKVQYVNQENKPTVEGMGFFIESSAQVADRCGLIHTKKTEAVEAVGPTMNKQIYIPYLFSRLISDARDFGFEFSGGHNSETFFNANKVTQTVLPYDFNDSGQVNSGIAPYWSFSPNWDYWFNLLRKAPFSRNGALTPLSPAEQKLWTAGVIDQATQLITKKDDVFKIIDDSPLQQTSKEQFHTHVYLLIRQFQKIVDDQAVPREGLAKPSGIW